MTVGVLGYCGYILLPSIACVCVCVCGVCSHVPVEVDHLVAPRVGADKVEDEAAPNVEAESVQEVAVEEACGDKRIDSTSRTPKTPHHPT